MPHCTRRNPTHASKLPDRMQSETHHRRLVPDARPDLVPLVTWIFGVPNFINALGQHWCPQPQDVHRQEPAKWLLAGPGGQSDGRPSHWGIRAPPINCVDQSLGEGPNLQANLRLCEGATRTSGSLSEVYIETQPTASLIRDLKY